MAWLVLSRVSFVGFPGYSAAKGAVEILALYVAKEFISRGIAGNTVTRDVIETGCYPTIFCLTPLRPYF